MRNAASIIAVAVFCSAPMTLLADTWFPFRNFRQVDPTGRFYVVVRQAPGGPEDPGRGTPVTFEIAEMKAGTAPVTNQGDADEDDDSSVDNPVVNVRDGDRVHGRGEFKRCPLKLLVSSTGLGFVGIDIRGYNFADRRDSDRDALVIVNPSGGVRHRKNLFDLFSDAEITHFQGTAGGVSWSDSGWIDERRREAVIVTSLLAMPDGTVTRYFRGVGLESGAVRKGSSADVVTALSSANPAALRFPLELTAELKLKEAIGHLPGLLGDASIPLAIRLRAAVALGVLDDERGAALVRATAVEGKPGRDQEYAVENLPVVIGPRAAGVLCEAVRRHGKRVTFQACHAMQSVPADVAVPALIKLLDGKESIACRTFAAECLSNKGAASKRAVPGLIQLLNAEPENDGILLSTRDYAAIALGRIGPAAKAALPDLIRLAEAHAKDEWERVKDKQPESRPDHFGGRKFSNDKLIDAICKIREK